MGSSSSKQPVVAPTTQQGYMPGIDVNKFATVPKEIVEMQQQQLEAARQAAEQAKLQAEAAAAAAASKAGLYFTILKWVGYILLLGGLIVGVLFLIDYIGETYFNTRPIGILPSKLNDATKPTTTKEKFTTYRESLENPEKGTGSYGIQWWMFIKDWNYGYGREKTVLQIKDGTNVNPKISLHPTDNVLKVTMSIFPNSEKEAVPNEPLPAKSADESVNDIYTCEIQNIPLQKWIAVSVTVFGRNLDIYMDGKLVKSCLLPGVPKPITGAIELSPDGGFSGFTCEVKKVDTIIQPKDAAAHAASEPSCKKDVTPTGQPATAISNATGYSIKFGMYDTVGKAIKEYVF